jgi:hypothetical protein
MWRLYLQAAQWRERPSALLDIEDPYHAFVLDEAVWELGSTIENEISKVEGKDARQIESRTKALLQKLLSGGSGYREPPTAP